MTDMHFRMLAIIFLCTCALIVMAAGEETPRL